MDRLITGLAALVLAGCFGESALPVALLSSVNATPTVVFSADATRVSALIRVNVGLACVVLDNDFAAKLDDLPMMIKSRGTTGEECSPPVIELEAPPRVAGGLITMTYPGHEISIGLGDLLVMRSMVVVPDGPFVFEPGQRIALRLSPAADLTQYRPVLYFSLAGMTTMDVPALEVVGDELHFTLPMTRPDSLEVLLIRYQDVWPLCGGAQCLMQHPISIVQALAWK